MRPVGQLKRRREIALLFSLREQREIPRLVLQHAGERQRRPETPLGMHFKVSQIAALEKFCVGLLVAIRELDVFVRGNPVGGRGPQADSLASYRVADDVAFVRVAVQVTDRPVEEPGAGWLDQARK